MKCLNPVQTFQLQQIHADILLFSWYIDCVSEALLPKVLNSVFHIQSLISKSYSISQDTSLTARRFLVCVLKCLNAINVHSKTRMKICNIFITTINIFSYIIWGWILMLLYNIQGKNMPEIKKMCIY